MPTRSSTPLTGAGGKPLAENEHVFGLAIDGQRTYVTKWNPGSLIRTTTSGGSPSVMDGNLGEEKIFSAIFVKQNHQPDGSKYKLRSMHRI